MKNKYTSYMISWIEKVDDSIPQPLVGKYKTLKAYWLDQGCDFDEEEFKNQLWTWLDNHGGSRITSDKQMIVARMILCLAYKDNRTIDELKDIGFFEDLLEQYGFSRQQINEQLEFIYS